jgi:glyoxylase-like metal-dependent hydrolase (beta-lactamase superfamily II)
MIITQPGRVSKRIQLLGRYESCVYLLQGREESWLLGGGMAYIVPELLEQIETFGIDERRISRICILHAHFDHCGAVPFLKKRWPWATVVASTRAKELIDKPQIVQSLARMNQNATARLGREALERSLGFQFDHLRVEATVAEGDRLRCGDLDLEVLEVPGHSSCSIAFYMPAERALFASDAVGLCTKGVHQPTPNSNYDQYQQSLEKMARLAPDLLLLEHFGAYTADDSRAFIPAAIEAARKTRELLEETYRRTRDIDRCTREITAIFLKRANDSFLSDDVRAMVAGQMVRFIAKNFEARNG